LGPLPSPELSILSVSSHGCNWEPDYLIIFPALFSQSTAVGFLEGFIQVLLPVLEPFSPWDLQMVLL